jgi:hypothetical protein
MKKLLIVSGRYILENLYRELRLTTLFERQGFQVVFALPSRKLNAFGYKDEVKSDAIFKSAGAVWLDSVRDYLDCLNQVDAALFGSIKDYLPLVELAHERGKPTLNFNSASGLDHWPHGVDIAYVKGPFSKRQMLYYQEAIPGHGNLKPDQIIITGSTIHEHFSASPSDDPTALGYEEFCQFYQLDPRLPITVVFPKGIGSFSKKTALWFPSWSEEKLAAYNQWVYDKYAQICKAAIEANHNLIIKMHPSSYTAYMCRTDSEYAYWRQFPQAKILDPAHTYPCYRHMACGVGVSTHSALDTAYFNKPFIFVDSHDLELPKSVTFHIAHLCKLPLGPSSHWDDTPLTYVNPWFPSWIGYYSQAKDLPDRLIQAAREPINQKHRQRFIEEFWHQADGQASERVVQYATEFINCWSTGKRLATVAKTYKSQARKTILTTISQRKAQLRHAVLKLIKS